MEDQEELAEAPIEFQQDVGKAKERELINMDEEEIDQFNQKFKKKAEKVRMPRMNDLQQNRDPYYRQIHY